MKFKNTILISIVLFFILTVGAVSAGDNSSDSNLGLSNDCSGDIVDSRDNDAGFEVNHYQSKFDSLDDDKLGKVDSEDKEVKSISPDFLNVEVPNKVEVWSSNDAVHMNFSLPKNSKGKISIYKDNNFIRTFDLEDKLFLSRFFDNCTIYKEDNKKKDLYQVWYRLNSEDIGVKTFTFRYDDGLGFIEKSGTVNITYIMKPSVNRVIYDEKVLIIIAPPNLKGTVNVEIDGKQYVSYSKIYKRRFFAVYNIKCLSGRCLVPENIKTQYVKLIPKLSIGKHRIKISYLGDEIYPSRSVEYVITVIGKIRVDSFYLDKGKKVSLVLPKDARGKLVLRFYDSKKRLVKRFTRKLRRGVAKIVIPKKFYGKFSKVVASYTGGDYKVKREVMSGVVINPPIKMPRSMLQGEKKFVSINLPKKRGVLKLYIYKYNKDGDFKLKEFSRRLVRGRARISLSRFDGDTEFSQIEFVETLKNGKKVVYVYDEYPMIYKRLDIYYSNLRYGRAEISIQGHMKGGKVLKNRYVIVKINNKFVGKVKTNKYGVALFRIPKKYKPNTYRVTVKYGRSVVSKKIKIKK